MISPVRFFETPKTRAVSYTVIGRLLSTLIGCRIFLLYAASFVIPKGRKPGEEPAVSRHHHEPRVPTLRALCEEWDSTAPSLRCFEKCHDLQEKEPSRRRDGTATSVPRSQLACETLPSFEFSGVDRCRRFFTGTFLVARGHGGRPSNCFLPLGCLLPLAMFLT